MSTQTNAVVTESVGDLLAGFDILWGRIEAAKRQQEEFQTFFKELKSQVSSFGNLFPIFLA